MKVWLNDLKIFKKLNGHKRNPVQPVDIFGDYVKSINKLFVNRNVLILKAEYLKA